jgi:hypothetical protein
MSGVRPWNVVGESPNQLAVACGNTALLAVLLHTAEVARHFNHTLLKRLSR